MLWKTDLGSATLYAILDGWGTRDPHDWFVGTTPEDWDGLGDHLDDEGRLPTSFGCFLFDNGERLVMIDTGFGADGTALPAGATAGLMPGALERLGVAPADVGTVVHTHLHPDHFLGDLDADGKPFFPDASYQVHARELSHWRTGTDDMSEVVRSVVEPLESHGALRAVDTGGRLVDGLSLVETFGHTPGHVSVLVSGEERSVMISGDVTYNPVHLAHPDWGLLLDVDPAQAAVTRSRFFADLATSGIPMVAGHYPRPGFGRVVSDGAVWRFLPLPVDVIA
jgi:glyoxylase-like metal-dependent hydrolase (beta-lactamase superfamily II)